MFSILHILSGALIIKAGNAMAVYQYLNLGELDCPVAIIKNVVSGKMGKKDIIKIDAPIDINFDAMGYIDSGIYKNGDKLPSVRYVALELSVNPNTVSKAYSLLESWGYISSINKKGAFVIFSGECIDKTEKILSSINELKSDGITYNEILTVLKGVYGND